MEQLPQKKQLQRFQESLYVGKWSIVRKAPIRTAYGVIFVSPSFSKPAQGFARLDPFVLPFAMDAIGLQDFQPWSRRNAVDMGYADVVYPTRPPSENSEEVEEKPLRKLLRDCCVAMGNLGLDGIGCDWMWLRTLEPNGNLKVW